MARAQHHLSSLRHQLDGLGLSINSAPSAGTLQPVLLGLTLKALTTTVPSTLPHIKLVNSASREGGKLRYALNGVSHVNPETPLKMAEYYGIADKVFKYDTIQDMPPAKIGKVVIQPNVLNQTFRNFVEIIFENHEKSMQSYHLDGYSFFAVASEMWERAYLGQQLYVSVLSPELSLRDEYNIPDNALLCGKVKGLPQPKPYTI
uniref:Plastocyanin-like domain-containing protein n=1 Tax=Salix viminalis TaxID=40686 RepID=A0A6N2M9V9_SALVM